jgi:hypothetical protein
MTPLARVAWLCAAGIIAFGAAGLVTAANPAPGGGARVELTWAADQAVTGPLESVVADLDPLALDLDALGGQGRGALAALVATDPDTLDRALAAGQQLVTKIEGETADLRARLAALPGTGPGVEIRLGGDVRARIVLATRALDATRGTAEAWATLSGGAPVATRLTRLLVIHDQASGDAARNGSQGLYADALRALDQADAVLTESRSLRDRLANTADVSTLSQWLDRNAAVDAALRHLYTVLDGTGGTMTDEARRALDDVNRARAQLPADTRALVVIMADIARAGLNAAVIRIEEARGTLATAITELGRGPGATQATPGGPGGPAASPGAASPAPDASDHPELVPPDA